MGLFVEDPEFCRLAVAINDLLGIESPPETWGNLSKACKEQAKPFIDGKKPAAKARGTGGGIGGLGGFGLGLSGLHGLGGLGGIGGVYKAGHTLVGAATESRSSPTAAALVSSTS